MLESIRPSATTREGTQATTVQRSQRAGRLAQDDNVSSATSFEGALRAAIVQQSGPVRAANVGERVHFSAHARLRLQERGIAVTEPLSARLGEAIDQLAARGARESLVSLGGVNYLVSVSNRTVVTAVPNGEGEARVFTHIDSAVVM
jgi:flagellar operon protein